MSFYPPNFLTILLVVIIIFVGFSLLFGCDVLPRIIINIYHNLL